MLVENALYEFTKAPGSCPAYAVFTSGTTGTPKGVLISRFNLESNIAVLSALYPDFPESRLLQACSHAFDGEPTHFFPRITSINKFKSLCLKYFLPGAEE